jgi:hypothetical protein
MLGEIEIVVVDPPLTIRIPDRVVTRTAQYEANPGSPLATCCSPWRCCPTAPAALLTPVVTAAASLIQQRIRGS